MENSESSRLRVAKLVERFREHVDAYKSGAYNETQLRREFLDPLFAAFGWDVNNLQGYAEAYKDVVHEDAIKIGTATKAPDYAFRVGGVRKFFVEAKKPSVYIKEELPPAYQLRRYAWSAKLPLSILTDFEEFAVYDCRIKPLPTDKAGKSRILYYTFEQYIEKFDEIKSIFSREAILRGAFDKYAESTKPRGTMEVDDEFLRDMEIWRASLAQNIASGNRALTVRELNHAVQMTIDRIVFLRICEDRGIEQYGSLMALLNGSGVYPRMIQIFKKADDRYNSGLFHFDKEKDRPEAPDTLTPNLVIGDKPLKEIIKRLYYPESPYEFSVLSADILGQVYERFLGKVIIPKGRSAEIVDKPEVKKAGGVYYTPTFIVRYIVANTVGKLVEGKTPKEVSAMRVLDPACGSGSFLLGAYEFLLGWHRDWYTNNNPEAHAKGKEPKVYQAGEHDWRLTTAEKKRILLNNIYGVDIDSQAVEVTKLSLLLKVLEGENSQTIDSQLRMFHTRALPDLQDNIKCGNSLIGPDFYEGQDTGLFDEEAQYRVNVFDWEREFKAIMRAGGFDAVIGNPPYVRQEGLGEFKEYFSDRFKVYHGTADLYSYFIERGVMLLRDGGIFGYIVANKWMRANYGGPLRQWIKGQEIVEITDFGDLPVFEKVTTYPCLLFIRRGKPSARFKAANIKTLERMDFQNYVDGCSFDMSPASLGDSGWSLSDEASSGLLDKLRKVGVPLGEYVGGKIYRGVLTGLNEAFVIDEETRARLIAEDPKSGEIIKPFLAGKEIKRYAHLNPKKYLILFPKGWTNANRGNQKAWEYFSERYPAIARHLEAFKDKAEKRCDKGDYWWELRACDYYEEFEKPKIIYPNICKKPEFTFNEEGLYANQKCFIIPGRDKYLLGVLNSTVAFFLFQTILPKLRGDFYEPSYVYFKDFPIRTIDFSNKADVARHDRMVSLVDSMLDLNRKLALTNTSHEKEMLTRRISHTDAEIDRLVYELYGLTPEEIRIVEVDKA